jgi:hypothetical protein
MLVLKKTDTPMSAHLQLCKCMYLAYTVLLHNGEFFNICTMKRCVHRKVDFKTNALNNAHVSQLLYYKAGLLQNNGIIIYLQNKTNS